MIIGDNTVAEIRVPIRMDWTLEDIGKALSFVGEVFESAGKGSIFVTKEREPKFMRLHPYIYVSDSETEDFYSHDCFDTVIAHGKNTYAVMDDWLAACSSECAKDRADEFLLFYVDGKRSAYSLSTNNVYLDSRFTDKDKFAKIVRIANRFKLLRESDAESFIDSLEVTNDGD